MKIRPTIALRRRHQRGSAVLVLLILLVIMVMLSAANSSALIHLHGELKLLDQRQVGRWNAWQANTATNVFSTAPPE